MRAATALFWIVVAAVLLNTATIVLSIIRPAMRVWPPPGRRSWQYVYNGVLSFTGLLGVVALGILDWNSFALHHWARFVVGGLLMACGVFALWGFVTLGVEASQGLGRALVTTGAYRYSRNPQYVGTIPAVVGYSVVCNSVLAGERRARWPDGSAVCVLARARTPLLPRQLRAGRGMRAVRITDASSSRPVPTEMYVGSDS